MKKESLRCDVINNLCDRFWNVLHCLIKSKPDASTNIEIEKKNVHTR